MATLFEQIMICPSQVHMIACVCTGIYMTYQEHVSWMFLHLQYLHISSYTCVGVFCPVLNAGEPKSYAQPRPLARRDKWPRLLLGLEADGATDGTYKIKLEVVIMKLIDIIYTYMHIYI